METITILSLSFKKAGLDIRSSFQFSENERLQLYPLLKRVAGLESAVIVSTCNRTELYLQTNDAFSAQAFIAYLQDFKGCSIPVELFDIYASTSESVRYLLEVGNGLHSLVMGDKQIISQLKVAFREGQQMGYVSTVLERVFQRVFRSYKRVNNETTFHKGSKSVSYLAITKIRQSDYLHAGLRVPILLIGAGEIAADFAKYAHSLGFSNVTITNRTAEKATVIAQKYGFNTLPFEQISAQGSTFNVIISAVSVVGVITATTMPPDQTKRLLIDLTTFKSIYLPRPSQSYELCTLDDLGTMRTQHEAQQLTAIPMVEEIIAQEVEAFQQWCRQKEAFAGLKKLKAEYDQLVRTQLASEGVAVTDQLLKKLTAARVKSHVLALQPTKAFALIGPCTR